MTTDVAAICAGLTKAQREAMLHANAGGCTYRWTSLGTAGGLCARKLVDRITGPGSFYSPQTATDWPLTDLGKQVRAALQQNDEGALTPPTPNKDEAR